MGLRYRLEYRNIERHCGAERLSVLDAGGGNGITAIQFAQAGHRVVVIDSSEAMLADGAAVAKEKELLEQIDFIAAEITDIPELFPEPVFDLVVCHNVIHYLDDPELSLQALLHPLRRSGLLSLVTLNGFSEVYKAAFRDLDLQKALDQLDVNRGHASIFDLSMRTFTEQELIDLVEDAGCTVEGFYGVRCLCDWLPNEPKFEDAFMSDPEELEFSLADRYPYYLLARFFQVICTKDGI